MSSGLSIATSRDEALNMFRTWLVDRAFVRIEFRCRAFAATFRARVADVTDEQLMFMADDKRAELVLPLPPDVTFRFLDMRGFPHEDEFERLLVMFYPFKVDPDESDQLAFAEEIECRDQ